MWVENWNKKAKVIQNATNDGKNEYLGCYHCRNYKTAKIAEPIVWSKSNRTARSTIAFRTSSELNNVELRVVYTYELCEKKTKVSWAY